MFSMINASHTRDARRRLLGATLGGLALIPRAALADAPESNRAIARSLFEQGRELMNARRFAEACPKFAESARLDPAPGTRLNLAVCHEGEGKTATAWQEFNDAVTQARVDGRIDREELARKHIADLVPVLSRLTIAVAPGPVPEGLEVRFDGVVIGQPAWGTATPVDPGPHTVTATAKGRAAWSERVDIKPAGDRRTVMIPALPPETSAPAAPQEGAGVKRALGWATIGLGVVGLGVGGYFGVQAISDWKDRNAACTTAGCQPSGVASGEAANKAAWGADVGIGVGLVALGVGTYLVVSSRARPEKHAEAGASPRLRGPVVAHVIPLSGPHGGGLAVGGSF